MKIKQQTIQDVSNQWTSLFSSMEECNYSIDFCVVGFEFYQDLNFFIHDLAIIIKDVLPHCDHIAGDVITVSFAHVKEVIASCLSYTFDPDDPLLNQSRLDVFWKLVKTHFSFPPIVCYQHIPATDSCFDTGVMWSFCFILLNEHNQGIIIYAAASD